MGEIVFQFNPSPMNFGPFLFVLVFSLIFLGSYILLFRKSFMLKYLPLYSLVLLTVNIAFLLEPILRTELFIHPDSLIYQARMWVSCLGAFVGLCFVVAIKKLDRRKPNEQS